MRACIFALAVTAVAQPALARDLHHSSHHVSHHRHHAAEGRHHHAARFHRGAGRFTRVRNAAPIESGYSMPQSFARTDATDTPFGQQAVPLAMPVSPVTPHVLGPARATPRNGALDAMIARHAAANGLPVGLVHRVVIRESRYNPRARNRGALGLMQIKHATARGVGYTGSASGLLDAETNLTYAVRYLAGAYRVAGGDEDRAVALYARGYNSNSGRASVRRPTRFAAFWSGLASRW